MPTSKGLAQVRPFAFASLAQQVEHAAVNRRVVGSNPPAPTMINAEFVYQTDPAFFMLMEAKYLVSL